jgi:hypothetical protein
MVNVGAAFYQCNATNNGYIGATSPSIQGLNIDKGCTTSIDLSSFTATPGDGNVILEWSTETEIDNMGFNLYRSEKKHTGYEKINDALIEAKGSDIQGASYQFIDTPLKNRKVYYYKLEDIDINGTITEHGPVKSIPRFIHGLKK